MISKSSPNLFEKFNEGNEIVYGVAKNGKQIHFLSGVRRNGFYKLMRKIGVELSPQSC